MARYIDADALMKKLNDDPIGQTIVHRYNIDGFIEAFPTADVVEVKHGDWIPILEINENGEPYQAGVYCSECGDAECYEPYFCPNCGADMRKETEDVGKSDTD